MADEHNAILANLVTVLSAIDGTGSYSLTMDTVERLAKSADGVKPGQKPWAGIVHMQTVAKSEHGSQFMCTMDVRIIVHVDAATNSARGAAVDNIIDDVLLAVYTDPTRDANASTTQVLNWETDEGDPDAQKATAVVFTLKIVYFRGVS